MLYEVGKAIAKAPFDLGRGIVDGVAEALGIDDDTLADQAGEDTKE